jgi:hypothetical protein
MQKKAISLLSIFFFAVSISACSGGGSDAPASPAPVPSAAVTSAEGLWNGTSDSGRSIAGLVLNDGTYWFLYTLRSNPSVVAGVVQGNGSSQNGSLTSSNTKDFNLEGLGILNASVNGSYVVKQSLQGTIVIANNGGQSTFTTTYDTDYDIPPNPALLTGTYSGSTATTGGVESVTVTVSAPGTITGSSASLCNFTGTFAPRSSGNAYDVSITFAGGTCSNGTNTVTGVAFFDATAKKLYSAGLNNTRTNGFVFIGTKP